MNKVLNKLLKSSQPDIFDNIRFATGQVISSEEEAIRSFQSKEDGELSDWRDFEFKLPKSIKNDTPHLFCDQFPLSNGEIHSLFLECNSRCGKCGGPFVKSVKTNLGSEYFIGIEILTKFKNHSELISRSDEYQVNSLFVDGIGFIEIVDTKAFFAISEIQETEKAVFVCRRYKVDSNQSFLDVHILSFENAKVYGVKDGKISEIFTTNFCKSCSSDFLGLATIDDLLILNRQDFPAFSELDTAWDFLDILKIFLTDSEIFKPNILQLSCDEYYFLSVLSHLIFGRKNFSYFVKYPILLELPCSTEDLLKKFLVKYEFASRIRYRPQILVSEGEVFDREVFADFQEISWRDLTPLGIQEQETNLFISDSAPTIAEVNEFRKFVTLQEDLRLLEVDGLDAYESAQNKINSNIYTYLNLGKYFQDLYTKHPLSKSRGLGLKDFSNLKSRVLKDNGGALDDITWRGVSFSSLFNINISDIKDKLGPLIPSARNVLELLCNFGLGSLFLGSELRLLDGRERIKLKLIKLESSLKSDKDILVITGIGSLLLFNRDRNFFLEFLRKIAVKGPKIIIVFNKLSHNF